MLAKLPLRRFGTHKWLLMQLLVESALGRARRKKYASGLDCGAATWGEEAAVKAQALLRQLLARPQQSSGPLMGRVRDVEDLDQQLIKLLMRRMELQPERQGQGGTAETVLADLDSVAQELVGVCGCGVVLTAA